MTCIVGLIENDEVWMGADSYCGGDDFQIPLKTPKIIRYGNWLLGTAGQFRGIQIIEHFVHPPQDSDQSTLSVLISEWIPKVQEAFEEHGHRIQNKGGDDFPACFLIAARDFIQSVHGSK